MFRIVDDVGKVLASGRDGLNPSSACQSGTYRIGPRYLQAYYPENSETHVKGWQDIAVYTHQSGWVAK